MNKMSCLRTVVLLLAVLSSQSLFAQDQLGIFFDPAGTSSTINTTSPYEQVSAWVQLVDPTSSEPITAFEFRVEIHSTGPDPILIWTLPNQALNMADEPVFIVGLGTPLAIEPRITLAEVNIIVPQANQTVWLTVHPLENPSLLDPPGYGYPVCSPVYSFGDEGQMLAMTAITGCDSEPVASINPDGNPPQIEIPNLPPSVIANKTNQTKLSQDKQIHQITLVNEGPVSYSGQIFVSGTTPVLFRINGGSLVEGPISFQVPVGSECQITPYYDGNESLDATIEIDICGAHWSVPVGDSDSWLNCSWAEDSLDFGEVTIGQNDYFDIELTNTGFVPLPVPMEILHPNFRLHRISSVGEFLAVGETCTFRAIFEPHNLGLHQWTIEINDGLCPLQLTGVCVDGPPACYLSENIIHFNNYIVGTGPRWESIDIRNIGGGILEGIIALNDTTGAYSLVPDTPADFSLAHNEGITIGISFEPLQEGVFIAELNLGLQCDPISFNGTAINVGPICEVQGTDLDNGVYTIPPAWVGYSRSGTVRVRNVGGGVLQGQATMEDTTGVFQLSGDTQYSLQHGQDAYVWVQFMPQEVGPASTLVHLGADCGDVLFIGEAVEPPSGCYAHLSRSNFHGVAVGDTLEATIFLRNSGYTVLEGELTLEGEGFELEEPGPFSIPVRERIYKKFRFVPPSIGDFSATISNGLDLCERNWTVTGQGIAPGSDQMGLYLDLEGTVNTLITDHPKVEETIYLVLHHPNAESLLTSWCSTYWANGPVVLPEHWNSLYPGHFGRYGLFKPFYLDTPVPFSETIVLADMSILVLDHTVAGKVESAFGKYDYATESGFSTNYIYDPNDLDINPGKSILDGRLVAPVANLNKDRVDIDWPCQQSASNGYHVYRRTEYGGVERLTSEPMVCTEGVGHFQDQDLPFDSQQWHYFLTSVANGKESLPGHEVTFKREQVNVETPLQSRTRLLAIHPNPFNPVTHISFELATAGLVQIMVYDLSGRLVKKLVDEHFESGQFETTWNGRDDAGRRMASNVYYARMTAGSVVEMRKMTLLK